MCHNILLQSSPVILWDCKKGRAVTSHWPWPYTFNHWNQISSSMGPSRCLCQIWRKSLREFLRYHLHKNGVHMNGWMDGLPQNIMPPGTPVTSTEGYKKNTCCSAKCESRWDDLSIQLTNVSCQGMGLLNIWTYFSPPFLFNQNRKKEKNRGEKVRERMTEKGCSAFQVNFSILRLTSKQHS